MTEEKIEFYAHTGAKPDRKDWQPLKEHLQNTANLAKQFAHQSELNMREE